MNHLRSQWNFRAWNLNHSGAVEGFWSQVWSWKYLVADYQLQDLKAWWKKKKEKKKKYFCQSKPNLLLPHWKTTTQVMQAGKISLPCCHYPSEIPRLLKGLSEFRGWLCREQSENMTDWLCMVGVVNILIHVCLPACGPLCIHLMNLWLPFRPTSEEESQRCRVPIHPKRSCWWHVIQYSSWVQLCVPVYRCVDRVETRRNIVKQRSNLVEASMLPSTFSIIVKSEWLLTLAQFYMKSSEEMWSISWINKDQTRFWHH